MNIIRNEKGFGLIEALVSIAILGIIAASFLVALTTASRAVLISDERTTAEALAKSQMESIKAQDYNLSGQYIQISLTDHPSFSISSRDLYDNEYEDIIGFGIPGQDGLQIIRLVVYNDGKEILTLEGYKADRT